MISQNKYLRNVIWGDESWEAEKTMRYQNKLGGERRLWNLSVIYLAGSKYKPNRSNISVFHNELLKVWKINKFKKKKSIPNP